jgi:hypothetical protein
MVLSDAAIFGLILVAVLSCLALDRYVAIRREKHAQSDSAVKRRFDLN